MEQQNTEAEIEQLKKITRKDGAEKYAEAQFKLGRIYYKYKKDWQKAIEHFLNIKKEDNPKDYAQAQFKLGSIYQYKFNDFEQAKSCYLNVKKQDNPEVYASAQLNLGVIYQNRQNIEQAKQCYLNVEKQDNPREYAAAQLNLGIIYENKQNIEQAERCYLNIKKQDNPEAYAQAQLHLGLIYQNKQDIEQGEQYYLNVRKQDNPEAYANAQLNLGIIYQYEYNNFEQAKQCYLKVKKQDNLEGYAQAQLNLGVIYQNKQETEQAELCYLKVDNQNNPDVYAKAQFNLGVIYQNKQDIELAKRCYLNIEKQNNSEAYAKAQFNLGVIYEEEKHNIEMAEHCYLNIEKQDNPKAYAQAQLNLGVIYQYKYKNFEYAERCYLNIEKQIGSALYNKAQFYLGIIYQIEKNNIDQAEHHYVNVKRQYHPETYAEAQFNLGVIYEKEKNDINKAEQYYLNVKNRDSPEAFANAQYNLGMLYFRRINFEKAEKAYKNVKNIIEDKTIYEISQYFLGVIYQFYKNENKKANKFFLQSCNSSNPMVFNQSNCALGDNFYFNNVTTNIKAAEKYYQNVTYLDDSFDSYIIAQVMLSVIKSNISKFENYIERNTYIVLPIYNIRELTRNIQNELHVTFKLNKNLKKQKQQFERQVAHYTKPEVLFNLLKNKPSDFRLNVVDFMNDPTENQVLTDWLGVKTEKDNEIKTFLASFSFNHNSLNQFRLYGNENNIVGSSVSVVFNENFFGDDIKRIINPASINQFFNNTDLGLPIDDSAKRVVANSINYFFNNTDFGLAINDSAKSVVATMGLNNSNENLNHKNYKTENNLKENSAIKISETIAEKNITSSVGFLPLFRCLYFDPKSGYISIAKRNKYSFYLEHQSDSPENIDAKWNNYLESLNEEAKINTVREKLQQIEEIIHSLKNPEEPKQKEIIEKITNLDQLIALALMPISCLVKHAAFEDEDECRMIYITNIADELIQAPKDYAYANSLFVNYGKIEDYLEKIYLGPQCQPHHKLWVTNHVRTSQSKTRSKPIKVVQSEMPLR